MKKTLYIAYGSNLSVAQMQYRCPTAKPIAKSWLHDYRLVFQGHEFGAHANVIPAEDQEVPVVVWELGPQDEAALDVYEGVRGGYYTKEYMTIEVDGEMREALIYIMTPHGYGAPARRYLDIIAEGYEDFNFDQTYLAKALTYSIRRRKKVRA